MQLKYVYLQRCVRTNTIHMLRHWNGRREIKWLALPHTPSISPGIKAMELHCWIFHWIELHVHWLEWTAMNFWWILWECHSDFAQSLWSSFSNIHKNSDQFAVSILNIIADSTLNANDRLAKFGSWPMENGESKNHWGPLQCTHSSEFGICAE